MKGENTSFFGKKIERLKEKVKRKKDKGEPDAPAALEKCPSNGSLQNNPRLPGGSIDGSTTDPAKKGGKQLLSSEETKDTGKERCITELQECALPTAVWYFGQVRGHRQEKIGGKPSAPHSTVMRHFPSSIFRRDTSTTTHHHTPK